MGKGPDIDGKVNIDTSDINLALDLMGLDDLNISAEIKVPDPLHTKMEMILPQPLKTDMRTEMAVTQPIVTQMSMDMAMDVKPVVLDLCLNLNIGRLPRTCIRRSYDRHLGLTMFGVEMIGFNRSGESQVVVDDLPSRAHVEPAGAPTSGHHHQHASEKEHRSGVVGRSGEGGLRIRLDG
jgi:hypothetical protein